MNVTANEIGVFADQGRFDRAEAAYAMALDYLKPPIGEYKEGSVANLFSEFALAKSKAGDHRAASSLFDRSLSYLVEYPKTYGPVGLPLLSDNVLYSRVGLVSWLLRKYEHFARQEPLAQRELALAVHDKLDSLLYFSWQQSNITPPRFAGDPRIRGHYEDVLKLLKILEEGTGTPEHYRAKAHQIIAKTKGNEMRRKMGQAEIAQKAGVPPEAIAQRQAYALAAKMIQYDLAATRSDAHGPLLDSLLMVTTKLREYDQVLSQQYPGFKRALERPVLPPPAALNQVVAEDQVLIDYFLTDTLIFAVAYTQATAFQHYILPKPSAFSSWVAGHLTDEVAAAKLYRCLLEPIVNELPATVKRIQIIPDEQIWDVVFPALRHEDQYLIEHYALGFAYSWQSLYYTSKLKASKKRNFAGYGADYAFLNQPPTIASNRGFGLGALPAAPAEVQAAAGIFAGDYWTNEDATRMAFTDNYQDYGVLHFALHGLLDASDPFNTSLAFVRSNRDTLALDLLPMSETLALPDFDCSLVSLSTCHSADGTNEVGEGVNSLARGFRLAGARTILASTREVNDQISYNILLKFYGRLRTNIPPDVAMQQALEVYLAEEKGAAFTQPLYWGNFVLIGSMDVLPSKWPLYQLILPIIGIISGLLVWKWCKHRKTRNA